MAGPGKFAANFRGAATMNAERIRSTAQNKSGLSRGRRTNGQAIRKVVTTFASQITNGNDVLRILFGIELDPGILAGGIIVLLQNRTLRIFKHDQRVEWKPEAIGSPCTAGLC